MRKMYVDVKVRLIIQAEEGVDLGEVISEMEYDFVSQTTGADIVDKEIKDFEVTDSK